MKRAVMTLKRSLQDLCDSFIYDKILWIVPVMVLHFGNPIAVHGKADTESFTTAEQLFVRRIAPLLQEKCLACHGADAGRIKGALDLTSRNKAMTGGDSGEPAILPGKPDQSPILLAMSRTSDDYNAMPPKQAEALSPQQIGWVRDWILAGADWPEPERARIIGQQFEKAWSAEDGVIVKTSGGLSPDWDNRKYHPELLWAYQPVRKPDLQGLKSGSSAIDFLIESANSTGLPPAPRASRSELLHRVYQDLTGLPPVEHRGMDLVFVAEVGDGYSVDQMALKDGHFLIRRVLITSLGHDENLMSNYSLL